MSLKKSFLTLTEVHWIDREFDRYRGPSLKFRDRELFAKTGLIVSLIGLPSIAFIGLLFKESIQMTLVSLSLPINLFLISSLLLQTIVLDKAEAERRLTAEKLRFLGKKNNFDEEKFKQHLNNEGFEVWAENYEVED